MTKTIQRLLPVEILFIITSAIILLFSAKWNEMGLDFKVLMGANLLFLVLTLISYFIQLRGLKNVNPHVFVRSVMMGMMLKMLICIAATFIYVKLAGDNFNKGSVFIALCLYLLYLSAEVYVVMRMNKTKNG